MTTVGRLTKNDLEIIGEVDERLPPITNGLIAHFPFDGTISAAYRPVTSSTKVLIQRHVYQSTSSPLFNYLNGIADITEVADISVISVATAQTYDLVVLDEFVWTVSDTDIALLKSFVDAGVSCIATGNDTMTNVFVESYTSFTQATHDVRIDSDTPVGLQGQIFVDQGSHDVARGITALRNGAEPYYYHADNGYIMGYVYVSNSGAVLYFDQEGEDPLNDYVKVGIEYALARTQATIDNVTIVNTHLGIEESTLNRVTNPTLSTSISNWSLGHYPAGTYDPLDGIYYDASVSYDSIGSLRIDKLPGDNTQTRAGQTVSGLTDGATYTFSAWVKQPTGCTHALLDVHDGGAWRAKWYSGSGEWEKLSLTITLNGVTSVGLRLAIYAGTSVAEQAWFNCVQFEQKPFDTSFVNGERTSNGQLTIQNLALNNFTLAFKFKPDYEYYTNFTSAYNRTMLIMYDADETRRIDYTDYHGTPPAASSYPFFDLEPNASWGTGSTNYHYHQTFGYTSDEWHNMFLIKSGSTLRAYFKKDGVLLCDELETYSTDTKLTDFVLSKLVLGSIDSDIWSGHFKDFSIYNRALTTEEMDKLADNKFSIQSNGDIRSFEVDERPSRIPNDAYYFPLYDNVKDSYGLIEPVEELNLTYEDNAVWVGKSITNIAPELSTWDSQRPSTESIEIPYGTNIGRKYTSGCLTSVWSGNVYLHNNFDYTMTGGTKYNASVWVYMSHDCNLDYARLVFEQGLSSYVEYDLTRKGTWQLLELEGTPAVTGNVRTLVYLSKYGQDTPDFTGHVIYSQPIVYAGDFTKPACIGTRGDSSIEFNLYNDIGLDWNGDWSIVYWKKPVGTRNDGMTDYNIESLGCNSNTVGGGYIWFGKATGTNTIYNATPSTFTPSDYFNKWHAISVVKSGGTITFKEWNVGANIHVRTSSVGTIASNYYVNQYGYDFKLGGWDNGNPCNAYFRDLVIAKRALTNEELNTIVNIPMYIDDRLNISNTINEVENL